MIGKWPTGSRFPPDATRSFATIGAEGEGLTEATGVGADCARAEALSAANAHAIPVATRIRPRIDG